MPARTLPGADPTLDVRDVAEAVVGRRLMLLTRDRPAAPALKTFLAAAREQAYRLDEELTTQGAPGAGGGTRRG